jgi:hypothetical protein
MCAASDVMPCTNLDATTVMCKAALHAGLLLVLVPRTLGVPSCMAAYDSCHTACGVCTPASGIVARSVEHQSIYFQLDHEQ